MKKILLFQLLLCSTLTAFSQITVQGTIRDIKSTPLGFAGIGLLSAKDSLLVKGALSDENGAFVITDVIPGEYRILASLMGYEKTYSDVFNLTADNKTATVDMTLKEMENLLAEAVIVAQRPLFEQKADRLVMNVANSPVAAGGTAMEILQKMPGVIVIQEQITLAGSNSVQIWIDGKPSQYTDVNAVLRDMPGDQIDRVELIRQPGARFDAAGGPVLNIILKKDAELGFTGTAAMTMGGSAYDQSDVRQGDQTYYRLVPSVNFNYRSGKWNLFGSYSYARRKSFNVQKVNRYIGDETYEQYNYSEIPSEFQNYRLGTDYYINKKTTLGVLFRGWNRNGISDAINVTDVYSTGAGQLLSTFYTGNHTASDRQNYAGNVNLKHDFNAKTGHVLNIDFDASRFNTTNVSDLSIYTDLLSSYVSLSQQNLDQPVGILVGKVDYTYPVDTTFKIDVGLKSSWAEVDNQLSFYRAEVLQPGESNDFLYNENINAAYVNVNKKWGKLELNAGLRAEQTIISGITQEVEVLDRNYLQLFPSASLLFGLNEHLGISGSFSRRVNRPGFQQQNPFAFFIDSLTFQQGNPSLLPEIVYSGQLALVYDNQPFVSVEYTSTDDVIIENAPRLEGTKTFTTAANLANNERWTFQLNFPVKLGKWLSGYGGNQFIYNAYDANYLDQQYTNSRWHWLAYTGVTATFPKGFKMELNGFYMTKFLEEFLTINQLGGLNFGLSKTFFDKRARIALNFNDILYTMNSTAHIDYQNVLVDFFQRGDSRNARLSLSYQFGNTKVKSARRRSTGSESETSRIKIE